MNKASNDQSRSPDSEDADIQAIRDRLLEKGLLYFVVVIPLTLAFSFSRIFEHGWHPIYLFQMVLAGLIIIGVVFKKHLSFRFRANLLLGFILLVGFMGTVSFGLVGGGPLLLVIFAVMTGIAFGTRAGLIASVIGLLIVILSGLALKTGVITFPFFIDEYAKSITAWAVIYTIFFMFVPMVVIALGVLHASLSTSLYGLRQSHTNHKRLANNLIDSFLYRHDTKGVFNYVSSSVTQILGYSTDEFLTPLADFMTEHSINVEAIKHTSQSINGIQQLPYEIQLYHKDCSIRWLEVSESPVLDNNGKVVSVEGVAHDITDRKRTEEALSASEKRFRSLAESANNAIISADTQGKIIFWNEASEIMFGYSVNEVIGKPISIIIPQRYQATHSNAFKNAVSNGKLKNKGRIFEFNGLRKNGSEFPISLVLSTWTNAEGVFFSAMVQDITERKRAEEALYESEKRNRAIFDQAPLGIAVIDSVSGEFLQINNAYCDMIGYTHEEMLSLNFMQISHPDDLPIDLENMQHLIAGEIEMFKMDKRIYKKDGSILWVTLTVVPLWVEKSEQHFHIAIVENITDRKLNEDQREKLIKLLEYKNKELQDIVYTASHDLRSPLVNIEGFSGELETDCKHLLELFVEESPSVEKSQEIEPIIKEGIPQSLGFIKGGAKKMASLLDGLLQISRVGTVKIKSESLDIDSIAREVLDSMEHQINANDINVTVDPLPKCIGDTHMMDHVFTNLISNAIKYRVPAKEGIIRISGKIDGCMSIYCVEDNGVGIASDCQKKVFEIFHRLNPKEDVEGEGLGLTIVTRILDRLGGEIWVESELGKGSKFFISLPTV